MEKRFFECPICGNIAIMAEFSGVIPSCCGEEMTQLNAHTKDEGKEKHVPQVEIISDHRLKVRIGEIPHPMALSHHIKFICLETDDGYQLKYLDPEGSPEAYFRFSGRPLAVYAYCNIHGLWKVCIE